MPLRPKLFYHRHYTTLTRRFKKQRVDAQAVDDRSLLSKLPLTWAELSTGPTAEMTATTSFLWF